MLRCAAGDVLQVGQSDPAGVDNGHTASVATDMCSLHGLGHEVRRAVGRRARAGRKAELARSVRSCQVLPRF